MGDIMRPIPFEELLTRIFDEYQQQRSIFGIPEQQFYSPVKGKTVSVFGETCATPVGPAAETGSPDAAHGWREKTAAKPTHHPVCS